MLEAEEIYRDAFRLWGQESAVALALGEAAELVAAVVQRDWQGRGDDAVKEEVVDVSIMAEQLAMIWEPPVAPCPSGATSTFLLAKAMGVLAKPPVPTEAAIDIVQNLVGACDILWPDRESSEEFHELKQLKLSRLYQKICATTNQMVMEPGEE